MGAMIQIRDFDFAFGKHEIFRRADFDVLPGLITALVGSNGSGKSTLFKQILRNPPKIPIKLGEGIKNTDIVLMSQDTVFPEKIRVQEFVELLLSINHSKIKNVDDLVALWSPKEQNRFEAMKHRMSAKCSTGEKKWLYLRVILSLEKKIYLLDEPTAGVDPEYRHLIWGLLKNHVNHDRGFVVSSHLLDELENRCDRFSMIHDLNILSYGSIEELAEATASENLEDAFLSVFSRSNERIGAKSEAL